MDLDVGDLRAQFPALGQEVRGKPLAWLDNAATTQKPRLVLEAISRHYERDNANVHRGVHTLAVRATEAYEAARARVAGFLHASDTGEIVFTRGATESINLVAECYGRSVLRAGDEVLITALEHHANLLPWQRVCRATGARLRIAPIDDRGALVVEEYARLVGPRTRIVAVAHASNALGTLNPVEELARLAHAQGAVVLIDGALAAAHLPAIDVAAIGCDFYVCSSHKMYGPTGLGVLWGKAALLDAMPPWQVGGDMVVRVEEDDATFAAPPLRFEAGTPHVDGAVGFAAALDWLDGLGPAAAAHERDLVAHAASALAEVPRVRLVGTAPERIAVVSFVVEGVHPHDVATVLDDEGIAVRAGDQCAQPLMRRLGVPGTVRASFAAYNTHDEVDRLVAATRRAVSLLT
jgi:cysteine desulfurase/selenocysteine lyase